LARTTVLRSSPSASQSSLAKRFPELENPNVRWAWRGWFLRSGEGTTFAYRVAQLS
jgi:hypothetical protein